MFLAAYGPMTIRPRVGQEAQMSVATSLPDLRDLTLPAGTVRDALDLDPHPEGGHYREVWRAAGSGGGRGASSSILFLLAAGERSHWHRVDAVETWLWQAGAPLRLEIADTSRHSDARVLGPALHRG
uniref:cupin domain-containing protein n=1 Tax=uncultured Sphingomonas sp. TaxID=158754 RepID=UPI0035CB90AF